GGTFGPNPSPAKAWIGANHTIEKATTVSRRLQLADTAHGSLASVVAEFEPNRSKIGICSQLTPLQKVDYSAGVFSEDFGFVTVRQSNAATRRPRETDGHSIRARRQPLAPRCFLQVSWNLDNLGDRGQRRLVDEHAARLTCRV